MASEDIISVYKADIEQFKSSLRELETRFSATENSAQANARKLNAVLDQQRALLRAEIQDLKELELRKKSAMSAAEVKQFEKAINDAKNSINNLKKGIGDVGAELKKSKDGAKLLGKEIKEAESKSKAFRGQLLQVGAAMGIAFSVQQIISFGKEAVMLAAKGEGIRIAFAKIGNEQTLEILRKATRGATSDIDLMSAALRARNFNITPELLAKGLDLAGRVARSTGQDITYLTNSFVDGLGRRSVKILDNLQISQVELRKEIKKTGDFNIAVGNITDRMLAKMGDVGLTTADKIAKINAQYDNMKEQAGGILVNIALSAGVAGDILAGLFNKIFNISDEASKKELTRMQKFTALAKEEQDKVLAFAEGGAKSLIKVQEKLSNDLLTAKTVAEKVEINRKKKELQRAIDSELGFIDDVKKLRAPKLRELTEEEKRLQEKKLKELKERIKDENKAVRDQAFYEFETIQKKNKDIADAQKKNEKERVKATEDAEDEINKARQKTTDLRQKDEADQVKREEEAQRRKLENLEALAQIATAFSDFFVQLSRNEANEQIAAVDERTQKEIDANQKQLDNKTITKEQFEARNKAIEAKAAAERSKIQTEQAQTEKNAALFNAGINGALAIIKAFTVDPTGILAIATAITTGLQFAAIAATPIPKFFEGTSYLERGKNKPGKDTIPVMAHEGERIVTASENAKNWDIYEHLRLGKFKEYVSMNFVAPALEAQMKEFEKAKKMDFANNIAQSILLNQKGMNDGNIVEGLKMNRRAVKESAEYIVKGISKQRSNPRKNV